jgi:hypothetical protein
VLSTPQRSLFAMGTMIRPGGCGSTMADMRERIPQG